jgi:hypothetical protein
MKKCHMCRTKNQFYEVRNQLENGQFLTYLKCRKCGAKQQKESSTGKAVPYLINQLMKGAY